MNQNACKYGAQCKTKACYFNHPDRPVCRIQNSCVRGDCWYNHDTQPCRFGERCMNSKCTFMHPNASPSGNTSETNRGSGQKLENHSNYRIQDEVSSSSSQSYVQDIPRQNCPINQGSNAKGTKAKEATEIQAPPNRPVNQGSNAKGTKAKDATEIQAPPNRPINQGSNAKGTKAKEAPEIQAQHSCLCSGTSNVNPNPKDNIVPQDGTKSRRKKKPKQPIQPLQPSLPSGILESQRKRNISTSSAPAGFPEWKFSSNNSNKTPPVQVEKRMTPPELKAIHDHKSIMSSVMEQIDLLQSADDFDTQNEQSKGTLEAFKKQHSELSLQLEVYLKIRKRAEGSLQNEDLSRQLQRELYRFLSRLPSLAARAEIENHMESGKSRFLIIQGQTGSGKSTQIAQYVADHPRFKEKRVICTQPRKLAAISLASRVAMEYSGGSPNSRPGHQIGYQVGGKKVGGNWCRIEFVTEGVMLDRIIRGSLDVFKDVGCIVLDEAHERSILCDILLGLFRSEDPRWKDIMIIVTSATIDLLEFSKFFKEAPTVEIEGRTFPVDFIYNAVPENCDIRSEVVKCAIKVHKSCKKQEGDILCFLPGQEDVISAKAIFDAEVSRLTISSSRFLEAEVFSLYGRQEPEEQAKVFEALPETKRKIIFATDVAETSITINGVVYVVDSGIKKEMVFDPKRNISSLRVKKISRSSAIQRAGRSGRTQPGQCYRLYSKDDFESMDINTAPEIFRRPLSLAILFLREMNIDPLTFSWISAPSTDAFAAADEELRYLKAVNENNRPTDLGKLIAQSQHEPKLVRMIYRGCQDGMGMAAVTITSILTISNIFFWNGTDSDSKVKSKKKRLEISDADGDIVTMYRLFEKWHRIQNNKKDGPNAEGIAGGNQSEGSNADASRIDTEVFDDQRENLTEILDTVSVISDASDSTPIPPNNILVQERRTNPRREAADWCRTNFINGKAMGLVVSTRAELLTLFKQTDVWKKNGSQETNPSNDQIKRLLFCGYFLHSARIIHSRNARTQQYFAVLPDVLGNLDFRAAILNHKDKESEDKFSPPKWIVYDKILRLSSTLFPLTSPIEASWIKDESEEFHELCLRKCETLPTEKVMKYASQECLRSIVGKYFSNLNSLENELNCTLDVDIESGILAAYCSLSNKPQVENALNVKVMNSLNTMKNQVIEEEYLGGTRVVIGQGYEVKDVLFPQEYTTLYIRKLPKDVSKDDLLNLVNKMKRGTNEIMRTIELIQHETNCSAVLKFVSKMAAKAALEHLKGETIQGQLVDVMPSGLGPKKGVTQGESSRLKISWPIGYSLGKANISFSTPSDANSCIERIDVLFPGSRVSRVHGELNASLGMVVNNINRRGGNKPLPPAMFSGGLVGRRRAARSGQNIRFIVGMEGYQDFEYKITIVDLTKNIDEHEIITRVRPAVPKWVKVDREADPKMKTACENGLPVEDRDKKLQLIRDFIQNDTITTMDFFDRNLCRAGISVYFNDKLTLQRAYRGVDFFVLGDMYGQPHRLEVEYVHSTSVHVDLYKFLEEDIERIKNDAYKQGVSTSKYSPKPNSYVKSKFVTMRFRSCNANLIQKVQSQLEELSSCTKFVCEKIDLLFTWTGRFKLEELAKKTFLHWNYRTHAIWIYGNPKVQKEVAKELHDIVKSLEAYEVFDKPLMLNKKKIDLNGKQNDWLKITRICHSSGLAYYHFNGNKLYASGSFDALAKLENSLDQNQFLFKRLPSKLASLHNGRLTCGLCFCPPEGSFILTSLCNHSFCMDCIQPMFSMQPPEFPVKCQECQALLVINDILKCAPLASLRKFLEVGVFKYQEQHPTEILICPKPGCNQLFSCGAKRTGEFGGDFYFCDECVTTYCMNCSQKVGKPIKTHEYDSCEDAQNGPSDVVVRHVKEIREQVFNLACPRCKTVFFDFEGCAAITCESCKCGFCGICLQDCGSDAHSHVKDACSKNPRKGEYYIDETQLNRVHRDMRANKLKEYLGRVDEEEVRTGILRAIRRDLVDLGIECKELTVSTESVKIQTEDTSCTIN